MKAELTKEEKILNSKYHTVDGVKALYQMITEYGNPVVILYSARFEAKNPRGNGSVIVNRVIDAGLKFSDDITIRNLPKSFCLSLDNAGIQIVKVRKDNYNPCKIPVATLREVKESFENKTIHEDSV